MIAHPESTAPLYQTLAAAVQGLIEQGSLRPGHRVPSVRRMALPRKVSIATVIQAYTTLEDRGYLEARPQSGYYVRPRLPGDTPEPRMARAMAKPSYVGVSDLTAEMIARANDPKSVALGAACPDPSLFPTQKLARLLGAAARGESLSLGRYAMNATYAPLAREISRRYLQAGTEISHDELLITIGCTEALNLSLRATTKPGDTVAIESPTYFGFLETTQALTLRAIEIPTDPRARISIEALRTALAQHDIKAVLVMPNFQNPIGSSMPDAKKQELYDLLCEHDIPAIEDDIYGELHFGDRRPSNLKSFDRDGRVLLCSSFGKTLAPGLRVGWIAPGRYFERVRRLKYTNTLGTPVVLQKTISDFLREGGYDHHLRSIRRAYQNQLQLTAQSVLRHFPAGTRISRPQGGFILWLELPASIDALRLHTEAAAHHITVAPGPLFSIKARYRNCLRLNCGLPWSDTLSQALQTLGTLAQQQLPT